MNLYKSVLLVTAILVTACQTEQSRPNSTESNRIVTSISTVESIKNPLSERVDDAKLVSVECKDPRPTICTREYNPVCAIRDTGVRCITEPCPSSERYSYANSCTACADLDVISYTQGECEE